MGRTIQGTLQRLVTGRGGLVEEFSQGEFQGGSQHTGWDPTSRTIRLANGSRITVLDADRPDATWRRFEYVWLDGEPRKSPELEQIRGRAQAVLRTTV